MRADDFARLSEGKHPRTGEQLVSQRLSHEYKTADGKTVDVVIFDLGVPVTGTLFRLKHNDLVTTQVNYVRSGGGDQIVRTGNGLIRVSSGRAESLAIGPIERRDIAMHVADNADLNVLGMNFLSSLQRWGVEGRWLVLVP